MGIIDIDRYPRSQRSTISLRDVVDVDVVHDSANGNPQAVWLSAQPASADELPAAPTTVVVPRTPCGCLILVALEERRSINLDAYPCPHHQPDELAIRSSQR